MTTEEGVECTSAEGITLGLIDSIMSIAGALQDRDLDESRAVQEALIDLSSNQHLKKLIDIGKELSYLSAIETVSD